MVTLWRMDDDVRLRALANRMRNKSMYLHAQQNLVRGEVWRLVRGFRSMNHKTIGFDGEMPKIKGNAMKLHAAAG